MSLFLLTARLQVVIDRKKLIFPPKNNSIAAIEFRFWPKCNWTKLFRWN